jgi:hypothetical protein
MGIEGPTIVNNSALLAQPLAEMPRDSDASRTLATVAANRETVLEHAIETLTRRLPFAADDEVTELVRERRAMRDELRALREVAAGNVVAIRRTS